MLDWSAALLTFLASAAMVVLGIVRPGPLWERVGVVASVFGLLGDRPDRQRGPKVRVAARGSERVVVRSHGGNAGLVHRHGIRVFSGELHVLAANRARALADRSRCPDHRAVDQILPSSLPANRAPGVGGNLNPGPSP